MRMEYRPWGRIGGGTFTQKGLGYIRESEQKTDPQMYGQNAKEAEKRIVQSKSL